MEKILNNLKENIAIYLVIILTIVIGLIIYFINPKPEEIKKDLDISMFHVKTVEETIKLFNSKEPVFLFIGRNSCSACAYYVPIVQITMAKQGFSVNYLELEGIDTESDSFKKLVDIMDYKYTLNDQEGTLGTFLGNTPMTVIIKNKKIVYGYIGSIEEEKLTHIVKEYGVVS